MVLSSNESVAFTQNENLSNHMTEPNSQTRQLCHDRLIVCRDNVLNWPLGRGTRTPPVMRD